MKKLSFLAATMIAACSMGFVSCTADEDPDAATITVKVNGSAILDNKSIEDSVGTTQNLEITAFMGTEKIEKVKIEEAVAGSNYVQLDTTLTKLLGLGGADKFGPYTYSTSVAATEKKVKITVTDKGALQTTFTVTIKMLTPKVEAGFMEVPLKLGAQKNASLGSFYSSVAGVLMLNAANTNQGSVDIAYYYGTNNKATLSSPTDADLTEIFSSVSAWTTKNATRIKKTDLTSENYKNNYDATIAEFAETDTKATDLKAGDYVAFKTKAGIPGLIKIVTVDTNNTGTIVGEVITKMPAAQ